MYFNENNFPTCKQVMSPMQTNRYSLPPSILSQEVRRAAHAAHAPLPSTSSSSSSSSWHGRTKMRLRRRVGGVKIHRQRAQQSPAVLLLTGSHSSHPTSTDRQIQSKRTEFVCPSSSRPLSAGSELCSTARQIQSKRTEFVCPSFPSAVRWLGTVLDGQTDSVKKNRIRLSVVIPSAIRWLGTCSTARQIQSKRTESVCPSSSRPLSAGSELRLTARHVCPSSSRPLSLAMNALECDAAMTMTSLMEK